MRFRFGSRAFSNLWVFLENAQHISVLDGRHKTFEIYAFSKENALVWSKRKEYVFCGVPVLCILNSCRSHFCERKGISENATSQRFVFD